MAFFANRFHFMENIVIIKTGAAGDVLRTTVLLHLFKGKNITWITAGHNHEVLPQEFPGLNILDLEMVNPSSIISDHTISLDDEIRCAGLATSIETKKITGTYSLRGDVQYTADSSEWFDMGLVSKLGKKIADDLKRKNSKSYQEILFNMFEKTFKGEEYISREDIVPGGNTEMIGLESRAGKRWPTKVWNQYPQLADTLVKKGFKIKWLQQKPDLKTYIEDIAACAMIITGDTLAMHVALAYKIPSVALFTCTSPAEIYPYSNLVKVVSPRIEEAFYSTTYHPEAVEAITVNMVIVAMNSIQQKPIH